MNRLNWIFTFSSLSVLLVTIERFSFTTKILLPPYDFIRLHELVQMTIIILLTVVIPILLLREVTNNFEAVRTKSGFWLFLMIIVGVYYYATGNGVHETASFFFNNYCDTQNFTGNFCGGLFINDYYLGNILYFVGGIFMILPLLIFEKKYPNPNFSRQDLPLLVINALLYAFAIFAYAAFDRVVVGLIYSAIMSCVALGFFWSVKDRVVQYPVIVYTTLTYVVGTTIATFVRVL
jgi:hypothetical protein